MTGPTGHTARTGSGTATPTVFAPGVKIDHFVVVDALGGGGMGVVVSAYDTQLDRRVAIKVLRPDARGRGAEEAGKLRLLREAQAMAKLSHPNVVVVHEIGTLGDQVFIAMEHVDGETLATWIEAGDRSWQDILAAFVQAGRGLAAAHHAGLVHRDFKPDNVLVGKDGRVRVTDFGLAAASRRDADNDRGAADLDVRFSDGSPLHIALTRTGVLLGTPTYMAPEQHSGATITPAADQFSFCVALYEALYGERPFSGGSCGELAERIEAGEIRPPPPGSRVPAWLRAAIVRGLRSEPAARHPSMDHLLAALTRDPVAARRRKLRSLGAGIGLLAAVAGIGLSQSRSRERDEPCQGFAARLTGVWDDDVKRAVATAFSSTGRSYASDTYTRVERNLDRYTSDLVAMRTEACRATRVGGDQSEQLMDLRIACLDRRTSKVATLTRLFTRRPDPDLLDTAVSAVNALPAVADCADTERLSMAVPLPGDAETRRRVETLRDRVDRGESLESAGKYRLALEIAKAATAEANQVDYAPLLAEALFLLARAEQGVGDAEAAERDFTAAAQVAARARDDVLGARAQAALLYVVGGIRTRYREAMAMLPAAEAAVLRAGDQALLRARLYENVGDVSRVGGDNAGARHYLERALALYEQILGRDSRRAALTLDSLGLVLANEGEFDKAREHHAEALAVLEKLYGHDHPLVGRELYHLGSSFHDMGRFQDARGYYERALELDRRVLGPDHPSLAYSLNALGELLHTLGEFKQAREYLEQALALWQKHLGADHALLAFPLSNIGSVLESQGKLREALDYHRRALEISERAFGPDHGDTGEGCYNLGNVLCLLGRYDEGLEHHRRALTIYEKQGGVDHPYVAAALTGIGECMVGAGRAEAAIAPLERALTIRETEQGDPAELARTQLVLARALWNEGGQRRRALRLGRAARASSIAAGERDRQRLAVIDAWLSKQR